MARKAPVLLLVMDGMSAAAATEILDDATERLDWVEAALAGGRTRRAAALSVLPSLTEVSRASLLCGRLTRGQQDAERAGYAELTAKSAKITATLFHKKGVDTTAPGALVADDVGAALDDVAGHPLVTIVLNTIDDALDRADPGGTDWTADAVKHLEPLLERARGAGRTVVLTADHGHIVERRRHPTQLPRCHAAVARAAPSGPVGPDEVQVARPAGPRPSDGAGGARGRRRPALRPAEGRLPRWRQRGRGRRPGRGPAARRGHHPLGLACCRPSSRAGGRSPATWCRRRPRDGNGPAYRGAPPARRRPARRGADPVRLPDATGPAPGRVAAVRRWSAARCSRQQRSLAARVVVTDDAGRPRSSTRWRARRRPGCRCPRRPRSWASARSGCAGRWPRCSGCSTSRGTPVLALTSTGAPWCWTCACCVSSSRCR